MQIGFHKLDARHAKALGGGSAQLQRGAGDVSPNHNPLRAGKVETHLPGAASNLQDPRVCGNGRIEQPREFAAFRAHSQSLQRVARPVAGEGRHFIKFADKIGAPVPRQAQVCNIVRGGIVRAAAAAGPCRVKGTLAGGAGEQVRKHFQKME